MACHPMRETLLAFVIQTVCDIGDERTKLGRR
jgi:hypothetical protein